MSRIGRLPIPVPTGVNVEIKGKEIVVSGTKGKLALTLPDVLDIKKEENHLIVSRKKEDGSVKALHGLFRSLIANMIKGVTDGFEETLELNPKFYNAYLGLGLFDYAMSFVPDFLKWAVNLTGLSSDKQRGFNYIKTAFKKGTEKTEAAFHLAKI